jgi:DNA-binding NarL/FixJ family response regulator
VIRVLLVDDSAAVRAGLAALLASTPDLVVVGSCADGSEAVAGAQRSAPDVVLMDLTMPGMDGISATAALRESCPDARVLILTTSTAGDAVHRARDAGAVGHLHKSADVATLLDAVRTVASGGTAWSDWAREALRHAR